MKTLLRHTLMVALLAAATAAGAQTQGWRPIPFVTAGGNYSQLCVDFGGRYGMQVGGGAILPLFSRGLVGVMPALAYVQKGDRHHFLVYNRERTLSIGANYLELPVDFLFSGRPLSSHMSVSALAGLYFAYGVGGKTSVSDGIYIYNRYNVADRPSTFGSEMGAERFDWGLRFGGMFRVDRYWVTAVIEGGIPTVMDSRITRQRYYDPVNLSLMLNLGYEF